VLVLRNQGPLGAPGMPEVGQQILIPPALQRDGVRDMVRITDGRMSGTMFGTILLHVAPEAAVGGPIALVQTGDTIVLDLAERRLDLLVDEAELEARRRAWVPPAPEGLSMYERLYRQHVGQAVDGSDFELTDATIGGGAGA
jgi:dihydroxyacid dehydratase/phosphogluconate dehydratase